MMLLETLLLMAAQVMAAQAGPAPPPAKGSPPPIELIEFLADWSDEDAKLIDSAGKPADKAGAAKKPRERRTNDAGGQTP